MNLDPGNLAEIAGKIALSAVLGGAVGAEREWTGKWAGLRTHILIAVGAALISDVSIQFGVRYAAGSNAWDPGRIAAQIVSGVGFLGAGTIIQARGTVRGLTTAAGLWVAAAIGMAVGARFYAEALVATLALLVTLTLLRPVESLLIRRHRRHLHFHLSEDDRLDELLQVLDLSGAEEREVRVRGRDAEGALTIEVRFTGSQELADRLLALASARGIPGEPVT